MFANEEILAMSMATDIVDTLENGNWNSMEPQKIYSFRSFNIVLSNYYPMGTIDYVNHTGQGSMMDALVVEISNGDKTEEVVLRGGKGYMGQPNLFYIWWC